MKIPVTRQYLNFQSAIKELEQNKVTPTPDECVWLYMLCEQIVAPTKYNIPCAVRPVIKIKDVTLFPLSLGASIWLDDFARKWWDGATNDGFLNKWIDPNFDMDLLSIAYAMAHSKKPEVFHELTEESHARLVIKTWAMKLSCSWKELKNAVLNFYKPYDTMEIQSPNEPQKTDDEPDAGMWGRIICKLANEYKQLPEYFMWQIPEEQFWEMVKGLKSDDNEKQTATHNLQEQEALRLVKKFIIEKRSNGTN